MSSTLYWEPENPPKSKALPDDIKYKIRELKGDNGEWVLNDTDLPMLNALASCGISGAKKLINAIHDYKTIRLQEKH